MMLGGVVIGLSVPGLGIRGRLIVWGICGSMIVVIASPAGGTMLNSRLSRGNVKGVGRGGRYSEMGNGIAREVSR